MLKFSGVTISSQFTQIEGRILMAPKLEVGNGEDFCPRNGRWNFNNQVLNDLDTVILAKFSARCNIPSLLQNLARCGEQKGIARGLKKHLKRLNAPKRMLDKLGGTFASQTISRIQIFTNIENVFPLFFFLQNRLK